MPNFRRISLTREDLATFLKDQRAIKEFERMFTQDDEVATIVNNILDGVGLNPDGTYIIPTGTNYLDSSTSIYDSLIILDGELWDVQLELDTTQAGAGLNTDGTYITPIGTNYINSATSIYNSTFLLDTAIGNTQDELDVTQLGAGLNTDGTYTALVGSYYIDTATSLYEADELLDEAIFNTSAELINSTLISVSLSAESQTILVDSSGGDIDITMPDPSLCFINGRSLKFGITKIDTSVNLVNVLPFSAETIVGETNQSMNSEGDIFNFITDGTNWHLQN